MAISGSTIVAVGDIARDFEAAETVACRGRVRHARARQRAHACADVACCAACADDLRLDVWLMGYMMPVEREFVGGRTSSRLGHRLACAEMIRSGTTCFADMYYFEDTVGEEAAGGRTASALRADGPQVPGSRLQNTGLRTKA